MVRNRFIWHSLKYVTKRSFFIFSFKLLTFNLTFLQNFHTKRSDKIPVIFFRYQFIGRRLWSSIYWLSIVVVNLLAVDCGRQFIGRRLWSSIYWSSIVVVNLLAVGCGRQFIGRRLWS